jgi:hypothetical protein
MPIKINLLAEALAEEDLRRRDPVKRAIFLGAFLVVLSLVWFSSIMLVRVIANSENSQVLREIQTRTNEFNLVQANLKIIAETRRRLDSLQKLEESRFLQGNLMNAFQQLYVPNVQLTRLRVDQSYTLIAGSSAVTNSFGVLPGKPARSAERIVLTVDAKDFSANPGDQVNRYKQVMGKHEFFQSAQSLANGIRLSNISPPQSSYDSKPYVLFTVECRFPDLTR